jgi:mono/diheme cytochrome c family protein
MPDSTKRLIMMAAFIFALAASSVSGFAADVQRGKQFARRVCGICHVVFKGQSPGDPNAPSFQSIARSQQFREKGISLLWENHPKMPTLALTQDESDDLTAYIKSLAK